MAYRKSSGEDIDSLRREVGSLREENGRLKRKNIDLTKTKVVPAWLWRFAWLVGLLASIYGVFHYVGKVNEVYRQNKAVERKVFDAANTWVDKYNHKEGSPFCWIEDATERGGGRLDPGKPVKCEVRFPDTKQTILIDCTAKACYMAKKQCKAI